MLPGHGWFSFLWRLRLQQMCCCVRLLLAKKAGWCFSPGCSNQVAVMEWEHETQKKTMNSGKVKVRPAAERGYKGIFKEFSGGKKKKKEQTTYILMNQKQYWKTTYYPYSDQKNMKINTSDIRSLQQESELSNKSASPISLCFCD